MTPYFERDGITLFHGDCREVLPALPEKSAGLVLTDPPYGIASVWKGGSGHGWSKAREQGEVRNEWDESTPSIQTMDLVLSRGEVAIVWGGNYFDLPPSRGWLVWNKPERGFSLAEAELAWTSRDAVIRVFDGPRSEPDREHPTQKPLKLMQWCIAWSKTSGAVLDPFSGSGTTLVAAFMAGRKAIGVEREERYCEVAARRLEREMAQGSLFKRGVA